MVIGHVAFGRILNAEQPFCMPVRLTDQVRRCAARGAVRRSKMDGLLWALVIIGGPVLLGLVVFLYSGRRRRRTPGEKAVSDQVARENWGKEEIR